jgi:hypothetical protein
MNKKKNSSVFQIIIMGILLVGCQKAVIGEKVEIFDKQSLLLPLLIQFDDLNGDWILAYKSILQTPETPSPENFYRIERAGSSFSASNRKTRDFILVVHALWKYSQRTPVFELDLQKAGDATQIWTPEFPELDYLSSTFCEKSVNQRESTYYHCEIAVEYPYTISRLVFSITGADLEDQEVETIIVDFLNLINQRFMQLGSVE